MREGRCPICGCLTHLPGCKLKGTERADPFAGWDDAYWRRFEELLCRAVREIKEELRGKMDKRD